MSMNPLQLFKKHACPKCESKEIIKVEGIFTYAWKCVFCGNIFSEGEMK